MNTSPGRSSNFLAGAQTGRGGLREGPRLTRASKHLRHSQAAACNLPHAFGICEVVEVVWSMTTGEIGKELVTVAKKQGGEIERA